MAVQLVQERAEVAQVEGGPNSTINHRSGQVEGSCVGVALGDRQHYDEMVGVVTHDLRNCFELIGII